MYIPQNTSSKLPAIAISGPFGAAVDFLSVQENVDTDRIGIIGICGWGGMAINAAAQLELAEPGVFIAKNPTVSCISGFPAYFMDRLR